MKNETGSSKLRFGAFDVVIIVIVLALIATLAFRFVSDRNLFAYDTDEYSVTVKANGLQYTTADKIGSGDVAYLPNGEILGTFTQATAFTPMLEYFVTSGGSLDALYYPDNTYIDITNEIKCNLISNDGVLCTKGGTRIVAGSVIEIHTQTVEITVEVVAVNKVAAE